MRAIVIEKRDLLLREVETPEPGPGQARVRVRACGVNRADVLQRKGAYPAPPDAPQDIPGLEIAGEVDAIGPGVFDRKVGDRVFGIVSGGAYAEAVVVHARTLAPIPDVAGTPMSFTDAAAVPEAFITAYDALVVQCGLTAGEHVLVHAAGSGVGTAAVQIARAIGARAIGTARTEEKLTRTAALGMVHGIVPESKEGRPVFAGAVQALTRGAGVDVVLDLVGGPYFEESLRALRGSGRIVLVGLLAGAQANLDLGLLLRQRLHIMGTVLRARPLEEKILATQLLERLAPLFGSGALVPIIARVLPLAGAADAHALMESNATFGKIILEM